MDSNDWSGESWGECMGFYKALGEVKGGYDGNNERVVSEECKVRSGCLAR